MQLLCRAPSIPDTDLGVRLSVTKNDQVPALHVSVQSVARCAGFNACKHAAKMHLVIDTRTVQIGGGQVAYNLQGVCLHRWVLKGLPQATALWGDV